MEGTTKAALPSQAAILSRARLWWPEILFGVLLVLVFWHAETLRFRLPQTPLIDPDSWGYLNPGFSKLTGGAFQHTFGRNFLYPAFVFVVLCVGGDFEVLTRAQHLIGLFTGVVLLLAWFVLCGFLKPTGRSRTLTRYLGLVLAADYLFARPQVLTEHTIRPESVFPFFLALSFLLNLAAIRAWLAEPRPRLAGWLLGANLVVVYAALSLKPSMGFGAAAANLPLLVWLWRSAEPWRLKARIVGAALALVVVALWLPEHQLAEKDAFGVIFLPTMLFTIHAPAIHEQIVEDLRKGDTAPYPAPWLGEFNRGLERSLTASMQPENGRWDKLGFNADYLIYRDSVFDPFFGSGKEREEAAFCLHYYRRTWLHRPGEMLAKVGRQLGIVYFEHEPNFRLPRFWNIKPWLKMKRWFRTRRGEAAPPLAAPAGPPTMGEDYQRAAESADNPSVKARLLASSYGAAYVQRVHALEDTHAVLWRDPWRGFLNEQLRFFNVPLLLAALAAGVVLLRRGGADHAALVGSVWLCALVNFAMFLTVAVAHTLEINRYVENQRLLTFLSEFAALLLPWRLLLLRRARVAPSPAPAAPA